MRDRDAWMRTSGSYPLAATQATAESPFPLAYGQFYPMPVTDKPSHKCQVWKGPEPVSYNRPGDVAEWPKAAAC
jgi:hypothetical protein